MRDPIEITVMNNIQKAREQANLTQEVLAEMLNTNQQQINRFEHTHCPRIKDLAKIASALGKPICYFFEA
jgi:transcriptional regulator with XRE-family HTH domain